MAILTFSETYAQELAFFNANFSSTDWSTIAQNAASPATLLYWSLHTADPGDGGSQTTNEIAYTNYARVSAARSTAGFTVTLGSGSTFTNTVNAAAVNFAACGATGATAAFWGLGLSSSGAGTLCRHGPLGPTAGPAIPFTCTSASPGSLTVYGYTPAVNDQIVVYQAPGTEGLPTGITGGTVYYVGTASGQTCTLSTTTSNGSPVNTSSTGSGILYKATPLAISSGITPSIAASAAIMQRS
jgi:hypothetical protein